MSSSRRWGRTGVLLLAPLALAQASTSTTSAPTSLMSSSTTLQLAALFQGQSFLSGFSFFTADDPTGGYVNYVDQATAQSSGLVQFDTSGAFIMRADSTNAASGRGRNSVRIGSNNYWNDGVYILDLNHMPVGCGTWPAFWTVVENGWPSGGEIDVIEGANLPPDASSSAWTATTAALNSSSLPSSPLGKVPSLAHDVVSLHTYDSCTLNNATWQTGTTGSLACSAYENANMGCGVVMAGNDTFGQDTLGRGFNAGGGGWYAMWRDIQNSGGVYVYYWPRNSPNVPSDVRNVNTQTTNVTNWGPPAANLTIPCKGDFGDHVIVFNIAFCGDYSAATYTAAGCPGTCTSFVAQNPGAFSQAYWSINSLRVYNANGKPIIPSRSSSLSMAAIIGIAAGGGGALILIGLACWWWTVVSRRKQRQQASANAALATMTQDDDSEDRLKSFSALASGNAFGNYSMFVGPDGPTGPEGQGAITPPSRGSEAEPNGSKIALLATAKNRSGKTTLVGDKTALHALDGETGHGYYHQQLDDAALASANAAGGVRGSAAGQRGSETGVAYNAIPSVSFSDARRKSSAFASAPGTRKSSNASEVWSPTRTRQPSLAPPSMSMAAQRARLKSVSNVGTPGYVTGSAMSGYSGNSFSAGGSISGGPGSRRQSAFQQVAGAQRSWVG